MRPNILWFCTDQQRFDTIAALGNPYAHTPNLDRLVKEGVVFQHAFCQSPICTPSRASFLTGMYSSSIHACMNGNDYWANAAPLVTKLLADAGYDCGLAGKLHLSAAQNRIEQRPDDGYRVFHSSHGVGSVWDNVTPEELGYNMYFNWLRSKGIKLNKEMNIPARLHQTAWCTDKAIEFITEKRNQPWLMSINTFDPHPPFDPPKEILDRYNADKMPGPLFRESDLTAQKKLEKIDFQTKVRRPEDFNAKVLQAAYYAMVELIDHNVGRLLSVLEDSGQYENSIIIFTSDHGEMLGDHGLLLKGCRFYEGLVHVPLIISWPGHFEKGLVSNALVELLDIAPSLLEITDLAVPKQMQGRSLVPILTGANESREHRNFVRCEYYRSLSPDHQPGFTGTYGTMIRDKRYKLVVYHAHDLGELFDLHKDPGEFENLYNDPKYANIRFNMMKKNFDALALAVDVGPKQVAWY